MAITVHWSLFEKQKLTGNNFMEWYRNLRIVLSTQDKLPFLEQPIPTLPVPPERQANPSDVAYQELLQTVRVFHACKQEERQSVSSYILKMKSYIDKMERLDHAMTQNLFVSLILVSLRKEYDGFVQNYNIRSMRKTVTKLHAMLGLHEQTLPPREVAPALHAIRGLRGSRKLKPGALSLYVGDGHRAGVKAIREFHLCLPSRLVLILHNCHYAPSITRGIISVSRLYKDGFVNRFENNNSIYVSRNNLIYFKAILRDDIYEIVLSNTNDSSMYAISNKRAKLNLDSALLWHCRLGHINKKHIKKLHHDGLLNSTDIKSFEKYVACISGKMARKPYSHQVERAKDLLRLIHTDGYEALVKCDTLTKPDKLEPRAFRCIFVGYPKETMGYSFYYLPKNKVFVAWNVGFFENDVIDHEVSGSLEDLEIIQEEDTHPSLDTSLDHEEDDQKIDEPQSDINPIRRSTRTSRVPDRMCLYVDFEEHELGDLVKPANYKAALLDPESDKWLNAMNVEMQSMKDNEVWELVNLPPDEKTVGHKWLFKKKTSMDGAVHTYKARLVAKGFIQTLGIDYKETFSPVADTRDIKILIAITAFYDYEICKSQGASTHAEIQRMQNISYASAVGSIMYALRCTRPDVAFALNITSRFQQNPEVIRNESSGFLATLMLGI
nr:hypothetical protein [Tanacetum cinerariifolium]